MIVDKKVMTEFLQMSKKIALKNSLSVLNNVQMTFSSDSLKMYVTNLSAALTTTIKTNTDSLVGKDDIEFLIPYDYFSNAVKADRDKTVEISLSESSVPSINGIELKIAELLCDGLPEIDTLPMKASGTINDWNRLQYIGNCVSKEETRYFMNGICFEFEEGSLRAVATDGRICAYTNNSDFGSYGTCEIDENESVIVKDLFNFLKIELPYFTITDTHVNFSNSIHVLTLKRIGGQFPIWKRIIPDDALMKQLDIPPTSFKGMLETSKLQCKLNGITPAQVKKAKVAIIITEHNFHLVHVNDNEIIQATNHLGTGNEYFENLSVKINLHYLNNLSLSDNCEWYLMKDANYNEYDKIVKYVDNKTGVSFVVMPMRNI